MPAITWTDKTASVQDWADYGHPIGESEQVVLFGGALVMGGPAAILTTSYTECSVAATSFTEKTVSATTFTEIAG